MYFGIVKPLATLTYVIDIILWLEAQAQPDSDTCIVSAFKSATLFATLWFIQGFVQGGVWPACAKILKQVIVRSQFHRTYPIKDENKMWCSESCTYIMYLKSNQHPL